MDLLTKKCVPCEGGTDPLTSEQEDMYHSAVPEWELSRTGVHLISRKFALQNFRSAVSLFQKIAELAETEGHHPDLHLTDYKFLTVSLTTHAISGLSENDFILAAKIDRIVTEEYSE